MKKTSFFDRINVSKGYNSAKTEKGGFRHIKGFGILSLAEGLEFTDESADCETVLVVLSGRCSVAVGTAMWEDIGGRKDVFEGSPAAIYIPPGEKYSVRGKDAQVAICKTHCEKSDTAPAIVRPEDVKIVDIGRGNWARQARLIFGPGSNTAKTIIGETINPPGNWSGIPPAKHERDSLPEESLHEELYYFKTDKPRGWGIERLYSQERKIDEFIYLEDGTATFMPWGYHQIVAAPGYALYYLFFLAGEGNRLAQFEDPEHSWVKGS